MRGTSSGAYPNPFRVQAVQAYLVEFGAAEQLCRGDSRGFFVIRARVE